MKAVRTLFVFVIMMTLITSAMATPSEATALLLGDTDGDGEVCITDATKIQRYVAKMTLIDNDCRCSADIDSDGIITIMDATSVQRWLAHFSVTYPIGEPIDIPADESNPAVITEPTVIRNHKTVTVDGTAFNISKIPDTITLDNTTGSTASFMLHNRLLPDPADVHIEISDCDSVRRIDYRDPRFKEYFLAADDRKGIGCDYLIRDNSGNEFAWVGAHLTNTAYPYQVNIRAFSGSTSFSVDFYYRNVLLKRTFVTVNLSAGYGNCDDTKALVREIENECWKPDMTDEEKINAFAAYIKSHYTLRQLKCVDGALYTALAARDLGLSSMLLYPKENGHPDLLTYNLYYDTTIPGGHCACLVEYGDCTMRYDVQGGACVIQPYLQ